MYSLMQIFEPSRKFCGEGRQTTVRWSVENGNFSAFGRYVFETFRDKAKIILW